MITPIKSVTKPYLNKSKTKYYLFDYQDHTGKIIKGKSLKTTNYDEALKNSEEFIMKKSLIKEVASEDSTIIKINHIWQRATGLLGSILTTILILTWSDLGTSNFFTWLLWLHLPILMFHEFEEYVLPGGFKHLMNYNSPLSKPEPKENAPLNEPFIFVINVGLWVWIIIGAMCIETIPWIGVSAVIFQFVNVVGHLFVFQIKTPGYNPGLITTFLLLVPYITVLIWHICTQSLLNPLEWALSVGFGFLGIILMVGSSRFIN